VTVDPLVDETDADLVVGWAFLTVVKMAVWLATSTVVLMAAWMVLVQVVRTVV